MSDPTGRENEPTPKLGLQLLGNDGVVCANEDCTLPPDASGSTEPHPSP